MRTVFTRAAALSAASILAIAAGSASAQTLDIGEIVITPSRTPQSASTVGSTVNTVDAEEIEEQALPVAVEYLGRLPGISISSEGGLGAGGSLSIRGAPRRYVKTLFNGIDIGDPTEPQTQTSYQYLLSDNLAGIEVLKGSQSTLYGSDAIAGVVALNTLGEIEQGVTHLLRGEAGSFGTVRGSYGLRAANLDSRVAVNLGGLRTDGISAAPGGAERDGYENVTFDAAGEHRFNDVVSVFGSLLYIDAEAEFDNGAFAPSPATDNLTATNLSRQLAGRGGINVDLLDGRFRNTLAFQAFDIDRTIAGTTFDGTYEGARQKLEYVGAFDVNDWLTVQGGADHEWQQAVFPEGSFNPRIEGDFGIGGIWSEIIAEPIAGLDLTAGLRHTIHSEFGSHTAYRATGSYQVEPTGTRFHGSAGTGFRAPSLNELFGPFGANPDLQPEESVSFDLGVEQTFLGGDLVLDATAFWIDTDNLIQYTFQYEQAEGTSRNRGVELSAAYRANDWLNLTGAYTYTRAVDPDGDRLVRVPRHQLALGAIVTPAENWTVAATAKFVADTVDGGVALDDYVLVNAKIAYQATDSTEIYLRGENLLDQNYRTAWGYNTPPLAVFAGFRSKIGP